MPSEPDPALAATVAEPDANGWRPIETAPRDGTVVLVYSASRGPVAARHVLSGYAERPVERWITEPGAWNVRPTHWQPLPPPPKEIEG